MRDRISRKYLFPAQLRGGLTPANAGERAGHGPLVRFSLFRFFFGSFFGLDSFLSVFFFCFLILRLFLFSFKNIFLIRANFKFGKILNWSKF
jgi:hypothetical protein